MKSLTLPALLVCLLPGFLRADDWFQWRGPDRSGVSKETGLLRTWPKGGPKLVWEAKGAGMGFASVAISKGKVFTLGDAPSTADDKNEYVLCFDDTTGKQLWKSKIGRSASHGGYAGGRSTPTVDGDRVYVITPYGGLYCLATADGKVEWEKDLQTAFGGKKGDDWGYSESPLIDGDKLICTPGKEKNTMVALDKMKGTTIWTASRKGDAGAGHASIVISEVGGVRVYVQTTAGGALGVRAADGKLMWSYPFGTTAVIPTPIVRGDLVFVAAGYGRGGALLRQVPGSENTVKVEEVYGMKTALNNRHGGIILLGDYLYGDTDHSGAPFCAEMMTGKQQWKERGSGSGSAAITAADGRLYIRFASGTMVLAEVNPKAYKEVSSFKIPGATGRPPSWSHPVVCNGRLYLREQDRILCFDIKDGASSRR